MPDTPQLFGSFPSVCGKVTGREGEEEPGCIFGPLFKQINLGSGEKSKRGGFEEKLYLL